MMAGDDDLVEPLTCWKNRHFNCHLSSALWGESTPVGLHIHLQPLQLCHEWRKHMLQQRGDMSAGFIGCFHLSITQ